MGKEPRTPESLVTEWQAENDPEGSFRRLFERRYASVCRFFGNRGFSEEESQDLTQETFIRVYKGMPSFRRQAKIETWLYRIATNVWRNAVRDRSAIKRSAEEVPVDHVAQAAEQGYREGGEALVEARGPLEAVLVDERARRVRDALAGLSPPLQRCTLLRLDQDLTYREIAQVLQIPEGTVKSQLATARELLSEKLRDYCDQAGW